MECLRRLSSTLYKVEVRRKCRLQTGPTSCGRHDLAHPVRGHGPTAGRANSRVVGVLVDNEGLETRGRPRWQGDMASAIPLAVDGQHAAAVRQVVNVADLQATDFGHAHSGVIEQVKSGPVAMLGQPLVARTR